MRNYISLLGLALTAMLITGHAAFGQQTSNPNVISYQGMLASSDGTPAPDGEYQITMTLYGDENGTRSVWQDTYQVPVRGGVFSLYLGAGKVSLPAPGQMDRPLWVGAQFSEGAELRPLTRLSATPYALNVPDKTITNSKLAADAVTKDKVNMDYVEGVSINGERVQGKGTVLKIQAGKDIDVRYDESTQSVVIGAATATGGNNNSSDKGGDHRLQGSALDAWTMRGEGINVSGGGPVAATSSDYIGTNAPANISFNIKANGQPAMIFQPNGTNTPSIIGGNGSNSAPGAGQGNVIAGGGSASATTANTIQGLLYNSVGGGEGNRILNGNSDYGTIGGGRSNSIGSAKVPVDDAIIGGGLGNSITASNSTIGGGRGNVIESDGNSSTIAGGRGNIVRGGELGSIGGGVTNEINGISGTISGGYENSISGDYNVIGGGLTNFANGYASGVFSGENNFTDGRSNIVAGGSSNWIMQGSNSVIAGGTENRIDGSSNGILSGSANYIERENSAIAGGLGNRILDVFGFIGSGDDNVIEREYGVIGGGRGNNNIGSFNIIGNGAFNYIRADFSVIVGGNSNAIDATSSFIGNGQSNIISGEYAAIVNGNSNQGVGRFSFIGNGENNAIGGDYGVIGGGIGNAVRGTASALGGGEMNGIEADYGVIGGGIGNAVTSSGSAATIPGGDNLMVQSYGQTAVGVWNAPRGSVPFRFGGLPRGNDPIFMVGNGVAPSRSNAFEVSYNGHSTVTGSSTPGLPVITGSTYTDNVIYAWGDVGVVGAAIVRNGDFGIRSITRQGAGWYRVRMDLNTPTGASINLSVASITANVSTNVPPGGMFSKCKYVAVSRVNTATNEFDIFITEQRINAGTMTLDCVNVDESFMFRVSGRP